MSARSDQAGFTVVELMIALTIVSLLMVVLISVYHFGQHLVESTRLTADRIQDAAVLRELLADTLGQVMRPDSRATLPAVRGTSRTLTIVSLGPRLLSASGPVVIDLSPDESDRGLLLAWRPAEGTPPGRPPRRIVAPAKQVRFSYFAGDRWTDGWERADLAPSLVRTQVFDPSEPDPVSSLIFSVATVVPRLCAMGHAAGSCGSPP